MVQQIALPAGFDGKKFAARHGLITGRGGNFRVEEIAGVATLIFPDAIPSPDAADNGDPIGDLRRIDPIYVRTTDGNPTTGFTFTLPTSSVLQILTLVTATNGTNVNTYHQLSTVKRGAGNAILVGTGNLIAPFEDAPAWNSVIAVTGATGIWQVTGAAATSIHWIMDVLHARLFNP